MNRRSIFKLLAAPAAVAVVRAENKPESVDTYEKPKEVDSFQHGPWKITWSGWKDEHASELLYGQWTATMPVGENLDWYFHGIVALTTGHIGVYHMADMFNLSQKEGEPWITERSTDYQREAQAHRTLKRLMEYLKTNPLANPNNCFLCGPPDKYAGNLKLALKHGPQERY